jgi:hypothetical protein
MEGDLWLRRPIIFSVELLCVRLIMCSGSQLAVLPAEWKAVRTGDWFWSPDTPIKELANKQNIIHRSRTTYLPGLREKFDRCKCRKSLTILRGKSFSVRLQCHSRGLWDGRQWMDRNRWTWSHLAASPKTSDIPHHSELQISYEECRLLGCDAVCHLCKQNIRKNVVPSSLSPSTLTMEEIRSSETSVLTTVTRYQKSDDGPPLYPQILHTINQLGFVAEK